MMKIRGDRHIVWGAIFMSPAWLYWWICWCDLQRGAAARRCAAMERRDLVFSFSAEEKEGRTATPLLNRRNYCCSSARAVVVVM